MKSVRSNALVLGGLIALAPPIAVVEMQAQEALALAGLTVTSPCEGPPWGPATILIRKGQIAVVDSTHKVTIPPDAETQDLSGTYVIPGLIDSHMHIFQGDGSATAVDAMRLDLEVLLSMGVTAVREMAGDARVLRRLAEEERAGAESPRIFFSALLAGPQQFARDPRGAAASQGMPLGSAPWMRAVSDTTNVEAVIRDAKETGATGIKLYAGLGEETVRRLAMEAKREGMRVWSHARIRPLPARRVVTTGVETVSHAHHFLDEIEPAEAARFRQAVDRDSTTQQASPRLRKVFDAMAERGVIFDPTLSLYEERRTGAAGSLVPSFVQRATPGSESSRGRTPQAKTPQKSLSSTESSNCWWNTVGLRRWRRSRQRRALQPTLSG